MKVKKIHDVSLPISGRMLVYPGNELPRLNWVRRIPGKSILSALRLGSHAGTHVDARLHVRHEAVVETVDRLPLEAFVGECRVIDLTKIPGNSVTEKDLRNHGVKKGEIILLKTKNSLLGYKQFREDYVHLDEAAARHLASKRIRTLGVDYLSVQKFNAGNYRVHEALLDAGVVIFEGLDLSKVRAGNYFFAGLPLNVVGAEGAPARVVLLELS